MAGNIVTSICNPVSALYSSCEGFTHAFPTVKAIVDYLDENETGAQYRIELTKLVRKLNDTTLLRNQHRKYAVTEFPLRNHMNEPYPEF